MGPLCPDSDPPGLGQSLCRYSFRSFPRDYEGIPGLLPLPVWGNVNLVFFPQGVKEKAVTSTLVFGLQASVSAAPSHPPFPAGVPLLPADVCAIS